MKITKDTTLAEALKNKKSKEVLEKYNLPCLSCPYAEEEMANLTLGEICQTYGIDLEGLLKDLNNIL
ncbi:MAG: DUF1858 domain-containing protein [Candidatus Pacebacteria bacterium]|nr:DUF1858 domain-containing protein [Candidatus Paceibacterota bacterium]